jgi:hypothetical protein
MTSRELVTTRMKGETGTCVASDLQPSGEQAERGQGLNVVVIQEPRSRRNCRVPPC